MSDDEYYGDYDDFEEGMWDADPAPDLADDLAEHAAYSPVWQDDPVGELEPYYSDWEYYSDDYYDDDPVLKNTTLDGTTSTQMSKTNFKPSKRGRKRKLDEACDPQITIKKGSLLDCIRGTVWAKQQEKKHVAFRLGQQESVALLKNWREMFKSDTGTLHTFGRGQLKRDESWANDLGLADMGLSNNKESSVARETAGLDDGREEDLVEEEEEDSDPEDLETMDDSAQLPRITKLDGEMLVHTAGVASFESDITDENPLPRKRRRITDLPSPPGSNESRGTATTKSSVKVSGSTKSEKRNRDRVYRLVAGADQNSREEATTESTHESTVRSKKRTFSSAAEDLDASDGVSTKRATKRSTSARLAEGHETPEGGIPSVARMTRSRLK